MDLNNLYDVHCHRSKPGARSIVNYYEGFSDLVGGPYASVGIHPWYPDRASLEELELALKKPEVVALGECGLDKVCDTDWQRQLILFREQIRLAEQYQKPLVIHCVRAWSELVAELKGVKVPIIIHGFTKGTELAQELLAKGYYLSVGFQVLKPASNEMVRQIPSTQLFCETDDRDESVFGVYKGIAEIRGIDLNSFALQVQKNVLKVFEIA